MFRKEKQNHLSEKWTSKTMNMDSICCDHFKKSWKYFKRTLSNIFNNYSLKSRWIVAKYLLSRESGHYSPRLKIIIVLVYTHEVISTKSERKPLKSTIWLTDQITRKFKNRSLQNFQTRLFTSLSFRKRQRNGLNGTAKSLNCFVTWEEK